MDLFGPSPRVCTIAPGAPFLATLSRALLGGDLVPGFAPAGDPLALASATILVPTRRAARALAATLAAEARSPALLLPRILPLGALEAIETDLLFDDTGFDAAFAPDRPDAIAPLSRRMILTRMILDWAQAVRRAVVAVGPDGTRTLHPHEELLVATSAADAWTLAGDLAALSDDLALEGVDAARLAPLGTDAFDQYWRITLDFLAIVIEAWPRILAARGEVDAAVRQIALIDAEIARLQRGTEGPVIVAGSTGSSPPTARLIGAIARLPQGAVVLPGLDQDLDAAGWAAIGPETATHPQATLKRLLGAIGLDRMAVRPLGHVASAVAGRTRFVGQALRPADTTELWRPYATSTQGADLRSALAGVTLIEAADERQEALALAIALREALEGPGTAMLVTPDRTLGLRVREDLTRWAIDIDASSGEPLGATPAGTLARLALDAVIQDHAPLGVLALLAHPLARFGRARTDVAALARTLEIAVLRGVVPPGALRDPAGLIARARAKAAAKHAPRPLRRLRDGDFDRLAALLDAVLAALAPLHGLRGGAPLPDWLAAHAAVSQAVAAMPGEDSALGGIDGHALAGLFDALAEAPEPAIRLDGAGYAALFDRFAAETPVRGPNRSHPRLKILGLLEARLLTADLVLLGGLDEGIWPPQSRTDAFLNRPMRASLGLPPPERRLGQTAHDLSMLMGAPRVVLSRAVKRGGTPTVPSRFLLRMAALAGAGWGAARARGAALLDLAAAIDRPAPVTPIRRPAPAPALDLRPTSLSVTRIETLRRDPYSIYAEKILELIPTDPIGATLGAREIGTQFHDVLARFVLDAPAAARPDPEAVLLAAVETAFAAACDDPQFRAFQWPRIRAWPRAFVAWEAERRAAGTTTLVEQEGRLRLPLMDGSVFDLTAYADRIEIRAGGFASVVDYKTGTPPSAAEVKVGFAPQLTLEAAMIERGAFAAIGEGVRVAEALYVKFEGKGGIKATALSWKDRILPGVIADHVEGLDTLLNAFRDPATGYMARPFPQFAGRFNAYDHLARVKEWSAGGLDEEEA